MATILQKIVAHAERLHDVRQLIDKTKEENKKVLEPLELEKETIEKVLISELDKNGLASIKVKTGEIFTKYTRHGIEIVNEPLALKWALDNMAVNIDKTLVKQKLKGVPEVPMGFRVVESDTIRVTLPK